MVTPSGMSAQFGWGADEASYGSTTTPTRFLPFRSEGFETGYDRVEADDIVAGAQTMRQDQTRKGNIGVTGSVGLYLFNRNIADLYRLLLGNVVTTGAGPYTHTITPGDLTGKSANYQIAKADNAGNLRPFTQKGGKLKAIKLAVTAGEFVTMDLDVIAQDTDTGAAVAAASYPSDLFRYHADDLTVTLGGNPVCIRNLSLDIVNSLDETRRCAGSALIGEPLRNGLLAVSGSVETEWTSLDRYNEVIALSYADLIIKFENGDDSLEFTSQVRLDSSSQPVSGRGAVYQTFAFTGQGAATDAETITVAVTNGDAVA